MTYVALLNYSNDVIIRGERCITNPTELYQALVLKDTSEIQITRPFADAYFTPSGLSDFVQNAQSVNPYVTVRVEADVREFNMRAVRALASYNSIEEVIYQLQANPKDMMGTIHMLCAAYADTYSETLVANNKVSALQLQNTELQQRLADLQEDYRVLLRDKSDVEAKLGMLVGRINYSYEKDIDPTQFTMIEGKARYSKVLYIKERTRVRYVDTMIYYLKEILRTLYSVPVREVVIGPYYAYEGARMYPHLQPSFDLSYSQVYKSDIYMPGYQPGVMEDILKNPSNVEYLIILDRCGFETPHVTGQGVEYIYTMTEPADNYDNIDPLRIISYSHDTLYIPHIERFADMSIEERIQRYSSMRVVKNIIDILERR